MEIPMLSDMFRAYDRIFSDKGVPHLDLTASILHPTRSLTKPSIIPLEQDVN